jgi:pimeloyl-ACP methyl ester carboxylesterase
VSAFGGHLHILENDISVPEPHRVPGVGHPSFAIALCGEHNVIEGNRIEGHPDGILLIADPGDGCRDNVIRDNTIAVRRVPFPATRPYEDMVRITDEADSTIVGVPLLLYAIAGEEEKGIVEGNLIEGNRLLGADGIALEVVGASRNRFVGNTISRVVARTPFPGNTLGSITGWGAANGAGIWLSPGSDENEIDGNVFEDVASYAIVIEGDRNRVETRSASDGVRDMGSGNRVGTPLTDIGLPEELGVLTDRFLRALNDEGSAFLAPFYAPAGRLLLADGTVLHGRDAIIGEFYRPFVARIRGVTPIASTSVGDDQVITVTTTYSATLAPSTDRGEASFSNSWVRQPDGSWEIAEGTFELPGDPAAARDGPIRDGFFHSGGVRLHYLDFGGEGLPVVFLHVGDRTAYTYMEFAPRFTDRNRVIALSLRGSGPSEGLPAPAVATAVLAGDVVTLLDSLGIDRAVVASAWQDIPVYLAEEHADRIAGLVLRGGRRSGGDGTTQTRLTIAAATPGSHLKTVLDMEAPRPDSAGGFSSRRGVSTPGRLRWGRDVTSGSWRRRGAATTASRGPRPEAGRGWRASGRRPWARARRARS